MGKIIGRKVNIGFGKESVRGTPVAPTFFIPHTELTIDEKITQAIDESATSVIEDANDAKITERRMEGTLRGIVRSDSFGLLLLAAIGQVSTVVDSPEAGANTHTFSVLQSAQHPSLTIVEKSDIDDFDYALSMIDSLELSFVQNEFLTYVIGFRSKKGVVGSNTTVITVESLFKPQDITFKTAADLSGLGAAPEAKIRAFNMTITKNLEDDRNLGSVDQDDILNKQFMAEGSVEILYEDQVFKGFVIDDVTRAMRIDLLHEDDITATTTKNQLTFDLAKVKFSEIARAQGINDLIMQTLTFKSFFSLSDSKSIEAVLINGTTSY